MIEEWLFLNLNETQVTLKSRFILLAPRAHWRRLVIAIGKCQRARQVDKTLGRQKIYASTKKRRSNFTFLKISKLKVK